MRPQETKSQSFLPEGLGAWQLVQTMWIPFSDTQDMGGSVWGSILKDQYQAPQNSHLASGA